jgi:hypothetical protein
MHNALLRDKSGQTFERVKAVDVRFGSLADILAQSGPSDRRL